MTGNGFKVSNSLNNGWVLMSITPPLKVPCSHIIVLSKKLLSVQKLVETWFANPHNGSVWPWWLMVRGGVKEGASVTWFRIWGRGRGGGRWLVVWEEGVQVRWLFWAGRVERCGSGDSWSERRERGKRGWVTRGPTPFSSWTESHIRVKTLSSILLRAWSATIIVCTEPQ